jgi:hypothetical protein
MKMWRGQVLPKNAKNPVNFGLSHITGSIAKQVHMGKKMAKAGVMTPGL